MTFFKTFIIARNHFIEQKLLNTDYLIHLDKTNKKTNLMHSVWLHDGVQMLFLFFWHDSSSVYVIPISIRPFASFVFPSYRQFASSFASHSLHFSSWKFFRKFSSKSIVTILGGLVPRKASRTLMCTAISNNRALL